MKPNEPQCRGCPPCNGDCCGMHDCPPIDPCPPSDPNAARWLLVILAVFWGLVALVVRSCS